MTDEVKIYEPKYKSSDIIKLPKEIQRFVQLANGFRVIEVDRDRLYQFCGEQIASIHVYAKQTDVKRDDIQLQANVLTDDLIKLFPRLTTQEVNEYIDCGVRGVYGPFYGLKNGTYLDWIRSGSEDEKRKDALARAEAIMIEKPWLPKPPTDAEKKAIAEEAIAKMIEVYNASETKGQVLNIGNVNFFYLWKTGRLRYDEKQKEIYRSLAEGKVYARLNAEKADHATNGNRDGVKKIDFMLDAIVNGDDDSQIKIEMGNLALTDWMDNLNKTTK